MSEAVGKKTLLVLVFGREAPSTRFRWFDFERRFRQADWQVTFLTLGELRDFENLKAFDVVVLQKTMVSRAVLKSIRRYAKRLVYDVDDRIWLRSGRPYSAFTRWKINRRMRMICQSVDVCLAANSWIADDLKHYGAASPSVHILPMAVDTEVWKYQAPKPGEPVIGWTGGPKNLSSLEMILPALKCVLSEGGCRLMIHCGQDPQWNDLDYTHIPYAAGQESQVVQGFDIGICPLPDDPFSRGKSPIKTLQYLASGAAVVASPYGAVQDLLTEGRSVLWSETQTQWQTQLSKLVADADLRRTLAEQGRQDLEQRYAADVVYAKLTTVLRELTV